MTKPKTNTDLTRLTSGKYCLNIHIDKSFVQSEISDRINNKSSSATQDTIATHIDLSNDVLNDLIRSAFEEATLENRLTPASAPVIELISKDSKDAYIFNATFDIIPFVDLNKLSSVYIKTPVVEVTTNDLESTIDAIFKQSPTREAALSALNISEAELGAFRQEVLINLQREAKTYENEIKKHSVLSQVCNIFDIAVPDCMLSPEIERLKKETKHEGLSTSELAIMAVNNLQRRIIINTVIQETHLTLHPQDVRQRVEKAATAYEKPEEVVQWYYSNRIELAGIEAKIIEELVIDWIIDACNQSSYKMSFTEAVAAISQL